jgi:hypothetical protein
MSEHEPTWAHRIWRDWRREILRGAFLFVAVAGVGMFILGQVRAFEPLSLIREGGGNFSDRDREWVDAFTWSGRVAGEPVWIRNLNGAIAIERATGDSVVVTGQKSWRRSDPESVEIVAVPSAGSVTICALWTARTAHCGPGGVYEMKGSKGHNDVAVRFVVRLPAGVALDASTVNGRVTANDVAGTLAIETVNGSVAVSDAGGPVTASTVNGSITAAVAAASGAHELDLKTVNGSITVRVPLDLDARLEASTVNGKVHSELPLQVMGRINPRRLEATIGRGGTPLRLKTVNGSVTLATLESGDAAPAPDVVAPAPKEPPGAPVGQAPRAPRAQIR